MTPNLVLDKKRMRVRIYKPAKTAMQSGTAGTKHWLLEPVAESDARSVEPLMGWTSSGDTTRQLHLYFSTKEAAVAFAEKHGLEYRVTEPKARTVKPKSYAENFK